MKPAIENPVVFLLKKQEKSDLRKSYSTNNLCRPNAVLVQPYAQNL